MMRVAAMAAKASLTPARSQVQLGNELNNAILED